MAEENITTPVKTEAEIAAEQENEKKLYNKARNRAAFRIHLLIFILVNALFWVIYFLFSKALRPMMFSSKLYCLSLSHG